MSDNKPRLDGKLPDSEFNSTLNDMLPKDSPAPRIVESEQQLCNLIDALDPKLAKPKNPKIGIVAPNNGTQFILKGLELLPKTAESLVVKQILLWRLGGDSITIDANHRIVISRFYFPKGHSYKKIFKLLIKYGLEEMMNLTSSKKLSPASRAKKVVDACLNTVCRQIEQDQPDIIPVIGSMN